MKPVKMFYRLDEIAEEWSNLSGEKITEDDVLQYGAESDWPIITSMVTQFNDGTKSFPALSICYLANGLEVDRAYDRNGKPVDCNPWFTGLLFLPPGTLREIMKGGSPKLLQGVDDETVGSFWFKTHYQVTRSDLVISSTEKDRFAQEYLIDTSKSNSESLDYWKARAEELEQRCETLESRLKTQFPLYLDSTNIHYSLELHAAVDAWGSMHIRGEHNPTQGAIKQIERWLEKNYPTLSRSAVERIAQVVNWNKAGGQPRSRN